MPPASRIAASYCRQYSSTCSSGSVPSGMWTFCRVDVDVVEQVLAHEAHVALQLVRLHREVFVEVERDDVLEREPLFLVQPDQLVVHAHGVLPVARPSTHVRPSAARLADERGNLRGDGACWPRRRGETRGRESSRSGAAPSADWRRARFARSGRPADCVGGFRPAGDSIVLMSSAQTSVVADAGTNRASVQTSILTRRALVSETPRCCRPAFGRA